ncbi:MAG: tetratricopeptide repeat protein [Candidatus Hodarchaeota archaeon]
MQLEISELETTLIPVNELLLKGKNTKAIKYLNKLLDQDPSNDQAWLLLGIAKRRIGKLDEALKCFTAAIELNNALLEAWGLLTITYLDKGFRKLAEESIDKAVVLNPQEEKFEFYRENLIRVYEKFGPFF